ncbi:MAG: glycosyltransferase family 4 protein [Candidatus Kapabacteria bacterium]|nr:glycosyltransferase family 4 protein [Candidatus Kapabacteria bacterium]MCS7169682.1 glycosyltransferase family 4 protein [Candidatus Kapabacteria bacterium]MDW7996055.1 glycosyltransferase family 4 protein [Bacteroidota bacterium]MDW8224515.1 glycosyltransferase family 4 protein [Bacteroidota bacterium]
MHVAILTYHFLPRLGGVEIAVHELATALVAVGLEVSVIAPQIPGDMRPPYHLVALPQWRGIPRWIRTYRALWDLYRRHPYDVLHVQMLYPAGYDACRFSSQRNIPTVISPQGADIHVYEPLGYGLRLSPRVERRVRIAARRATVVTVSSRLMQREMALLAPQVAERAVYLPNGTWVDRFRGYNRQELRLHFGLQPEEVVFITVSRNSPIKGLPLLLRVARRLGAEFPQGWRLWIIGVGTGELASAAQGIPVEFIGHIPVERDARGAPIQPPTALAQRLLAADVYVTPAFSGGFELSCADAFASGLPVIICRTNGAQDLVQDYGAGIVVPPADESALLSALRWMILHPVERQAMRHRSCEVAQQLDWKVLAERCHRLYESLRG